MVSNQHDQFSPGISRGSGKGLFLILVGSIAFFAVIPASFAFSGDGGSFITVFLFGILGSFVLLAVGAFMFAMAQSEPEAGERPTNTTPTGSPHSAPPSHPAYQPASHPPITPAAPIIIQHIGEYVAGSKINIRDSVLNRSHVGDNGIKDDGMKDDGIKDDGMRDDGIKDGGMRDDGMGDRGETTINGDTATDTSEPVPPINGPTLLDEYRRILREAWSDGTLSPGEFDFLDRVRESEGISMEQHRMVQQEIFAEMGTS
jgi:hypothetical protein